MKNHLMLAAAAVATFAAAPAFAQAYTGGTATFTGIGDNIGGMFDIADFAPVAGTYAGSGTYDLNTVTFTAGPNNTGSPTLYGVLTGLTGTFGGADFTYNVNYKISIGSSDTITLGNNFFNVGGTAVKINALTLNSGGTPSLGTLTVSTGSAVPEPATWAMMLLGFGMVGFGLRYRRKSSKVSFA